MYIFGPADLAALKATFSPDFMNEFLQMLPLFFGGLFAGYWTNFFESKRVRQEKRRDGYYQHRNAIVQIEQELIPLRIKIARDIKSINDAIDNSSENHARFILKFDKLFLSTGLGLKLLNLKLIRQYADLYSDVDTFNSDLDYASSIVQSLLENKKLEKVLDRSIVSTYLQLLPYLKKKAEGIDQKSLDLLTMCQVAILKEKEKRIIEEFMASGDQIHYEMNIKDLADQQKNIEQEEDFTQHPDEKIPQFFALYLDIYW